MPPAWSFVRPLLSHSVAIRSTFCKTPPLYTPCMHTSSFPPCFGTPLFNSTHFAHMLSPLQMLCHPALGVVPHGPFAELQAQAQAIFLLSHFLVLRPLQYRLHSCKHTGTGSTKAVAHNIASGSFISLTVSGPLDVSFFLRTELSIRCFRVAVKPNSDWPIKMALQSGFSASSQLNGLCQVSPPPLRHQSPLHSLIRETSAKSPTSVNGSIMTRKIRLGSQPMPARQGKGKYRGRFRNIIN